MEKAEETQAEPPASDGASPEEISLDGMNQVPAQSFFYDTQPCSIVSGATRGTGNVLIGGLSALTLTFGGLSMGAVKGYNEYGVIGAVGGFVVGGIVGSLGGACAAIMGAFTGIKQIGTGLIRTPTAMVNAAIGKEWDDIKQNWDFYDLKKESDIILGVSEEKFLKFIKDGGSLCLLLNNGTIQISNDISDNNNSNNNTIENESSNNKQQPVVEKKNIVDRTLYDVLGVEPEATSVEIKKAYYVKARQNHPDRHPNDPDAHKKFQLIGEAYQILGDERMRTVYDSKGKSVVESSHKVDASSLYAMVFGSENFESIIGELQVASTIKMLTEMGMNNEYNHPELLLFRQRKREVQLASILATKLDTINEGVEEFKTKIKQETIELAETAFGGTLLAVIAGIYADKTYGKSNPFSSMFYTSKETTQSVSDAFSIFGNSFRVASKASTLQAIHMKSDKRKENQDKELLERNEITEEEMIRRKEQIQKDREQNAMAMNAPPKDATPEEIKEYKGVMTDLANTGCYVMWKLTKIDIRSTLSMVCNKVLNDHSVKKDVRRKRREALLLVAQIYNEKAVSSKDGLDEVAKKFGLFADVPVYESEQSSDPTALPSESAAEESNDPTDTPSEFEGFSTEEILKNVDTYSISTLKELINRHGGNSTECIEKVDLKNHLLSLLKVDSKDNIVQVSNDSEVTID